MRTRTSFYLLGWGLAGFASLMLVWAMGALGVLAVEGDPADRMYFGVFAIGATAALLGRFRAAGMVRAALAMVFAIGGVTVIALALGMHNSPISSVAEIVGVNAMFAAMYGGAAWLFAQAARVERLADAPLA
ncbi:transmembrane protein [alpha proteobacterium U9-1i]|nr:transmembrane protein [alpha proteobacterium U9-1i]